MRFLHRLVISLAVSLVAHLYLKQRPDWVFLVLWSEFHVFGQLCNFTFEPLNLRAHNNLKGLLLMFSKRNLGLEELRDFGLVGFEKIIGHNSYLPALQLSCSTLRSQRLDSRLRSRRYSPLWKNY